MKNIRIFIAVLMLFFGLSCIANASFITVDEYIYKSGDMSQAQAQNLSANVDMTWNEGAGLLTIILTNTSGLTTGTTATASNVLTGLGFNLPSGVTIVDTAGQNSSVSLTSGSTVVQGGTFSQDTWGWESGVTGGHFYTVPDITVNAAVSAMAADSSITFGGGNKAVLDGPDYGLLSGSGSPGPAGRAAIQSSVTIYLYLSGVPEGSKLLSYIDANGVVAEFGSPDTVVQKTPLPISILLLAPGLAGLVIFRRRSQKPSAS
jgi:hypothetical protein